MEGGGEAGNPASPSSVLPRGMPQRVPNSLGERRHAPWVVSPGQQEELPPGEDKAGQGGTGGG